MFILYGFASQIKQCGDCFDIESNFKKVSGVTAKKKKKLLFLYTYHKLTEIEEKEDKMQQMFKQVEMKNMEVQRYKTAAEVAKVTNYFKRMSCAC